MNTRELDLRKLNSLTKYPSILTYHELDPRNGTLMEEVQVPLTGDLVATEKVDGTNSRLIFLPDKMYIIASREELLYARGDLIGNDELGIVTATKALAEQLAVPLASRDLPIVTVIYLEVYGGDFAKGCKQYTSKEEYGYRMFDLIHFSNGRFFELMGWPVEKFSGWRERGGQPYVGEDELQNFSHRWNVPLTPRISVGPVPLSIDDTLAYLKASIAKSQCTLDATAPGMPEGLVIRKADRSLIAKLRFEDYERTIRKRGSR